MELEYCKTHAIWVQLDLTAVRYFTRVYSYGVSILQSKWPRLKLRFHIMKVEVSISLDRHYARVRAFNFVLPNLAILIPNRFLSKPTDEGRQRHRQGLHSVAAP